MAALFSGILPALRRGDGAFSLKMLDLAPLGNGASPVVVLDDFRVTSRPFPPHPHAGFSAVTYVFEDSPGALRSRDSLGHDVVVGPGGIVWTQAGRGIIHQEVPASAAELHGLQLFVNLSARHKHVAPQMLHLAPQEVPVWLGPEGDRVRVVVGSYGGLTSPLVPTEPFLFLDATLRSGLEITIPEGYNAILYALAGDLAVRSGAEAVRLQAEQALVLACDGLSVTLEGAAHVVLLAGPAQHDPVVIDGPFIMNDPAEIEEASARYHAGAMGRLFPAPPL